MYIYLDESYNLKDRDRKQFVSINGFMTADTRFLFKKWREYRKPFAEKGRRIHAKEKHFDILRAKARELFDQGNIALLSVFQVVQEIPPGSRLYRHGKLNFDELYFRMLIELFKAMKPDEYRRFIITVDNRKHKGSLGKERFRRDILSFLRNNNPGTLFDFLFQASTTNILLELADFYSHIFYQAHMNNDSSFLRDLRPRIYIIKNPLNKSTDPL